MDAVDDDLDTFFNSTSDFRMKQEESRPIAPKTDYLRGAAPDSYTSGRNEPSSFLSNANSIFGAFTGSLAAGLSRQGANDAKAAATEQWNRHVGSLRSWREFAWPIRLNCDHGISGAKQNIVYFKTNYSFVFLLNLCLSILLNPSSLITACFLCIAWVVFLKKNDDPEWTVVIAGMSLGPTQRMVVMSVVTVVLSLVFIGQTIFSACLMFSILGLIHVFIHVPPQTLGHDSTEDAVIPI